MEVDVQRQRHRKLEDLQEGLGDEGGGGGGEGGDGRMNQCERRKEA